MSSPEKPFACSAPDCGLTFTNEEHLTVHSKKHDMALQLGLGQKVSAFPADQTPTPTRFIRNCEEVGLFQELQSVNPFDEGFKRAMEAEGGILISLDSAIAAATSDDALHTPHIFPNLVDVPDSGLYAASSRKHTVTRSSSDESTTVKHFETIETKLTNEVTIEKRDKNMPPNNTIMIQSNIEICKSDFSTIVSNDMNLGKIDKDLNVVRKDVMLTDTGKTPIMSQQSLEFAIDSLTAHVEEVKNSDKEQQAGRNLALIDTMKKNMKNALENATKNILKSKAIESDKEVRVEVRKRGKKRRPSDFKMDKDNYEVMLKLPNGDLVHMRSNDKNKPATDAKQKLKDAIENKIKSELETEIRSNIESRIKNEILLKVKDIESMKPVPPPATADKLSPLLYQIANPKIETIAPYPVAVISPISNMMFPVSKIAIAPDKYANKLPEKKQRKVYQKKSSYMFPPKSIETKNVQHKSNCDILSKLGAQCSLKCAEEMNSNIVQHRIESTASPDIEVVDSRVNENHIGITVYSKSNKIESNLISSSSNSGSITSARIANNLHLTATSKVSSVNRVFETNSSKMASKLNHPGKKLITDKVAIVKSTKNYTTASQRSEQKAKVNKPNSNKNVDGDFKKESRLEAVRRYRHRQKNKVLTLTEVNRTLTLEYNSMAAELERTKMEMAALKVAVMKHCESCTTANDLRNKYGMLLEQKSKKDSNDKQ